MRTPSPIRGAGFIAALLAIPPALAGPGSIPFEPAPSPRRIATAFSPAVANVSVATRELALELTPALVQAAPSSALFRDRLWGATATLRLLFAFQPGEWQTQDAFQLFVLKLPMPEQGTDSFSSRRSRRHSNGLAYTHQRASGGTRGRISIRHRSDSIGSRD